MSKNRASATDEGNIDRVIADAKKDGVTEEIMKASSNSIFNIDKTI